MVSLVNKNKMGILELFFRVLPGLRICYHEYWQFGRVEQDHIEKLQTGVCEAAIFISRINGKRPEFGKKDSV